MAARKPVTLQDIATKIGVNISTVSLALKDHPRISAKRRAEIWAMARKLDYHVNTHAATLARQKQRPVKITAALAWINDWPDPAQLRIFKEFDAYWQGAFDAAETRGYRLEEFRWNEHGGAKRLAKILRNRGVYGALVAPSYRGLGRDWAPLLDANLAVVKFGLSAINDKFRNLVASDQSLNSRIAVQEMERCGYRRIGFVTRVNDINQNAFRAGFLIAQLSSDQGAVIAPLALSWSGLEDNLRELRQWIEKERPDAIFTNIGNLRSMLLRLNKRVPHDIGLAGTSILDVKTDTGIDPQPYFIGRAATERVISLTQLPGANSPQPVSQLLIAGKWISGADLPPKPILAAI